MFKCVARVQDMTTFCLRDLSLIISRNVHKGAEHLSGWHVILTQIDSERGALGPIVSLRAFCRKIARGPSS